MIDIKLGAPESIEGGANKKATISVQNMMRLKELTLADGATEEGSIVTAGRLLAQLKAEEEMPVSDNLRIDVKPIGSDTIAIGCTGCELHAYKDDEEIDVLFAVEGIENVASVNKNIVTFISKDEIAKFKVTCFCDLEKCEIHAHINIGIIYPDFANILRENPKYAKAFLLWPEVIHSLIDTEKRNIIFLEYDSSQTGYINTKITCSTDLSYEIKFKFNNDPVILGGGGSNNENQVRLQYYDHDKYTLNYLGTFNYPKHTMNKWTTIGCNKELYYIDDVITRRPVDVSQFVETPEFPITIFATNTNSSPLSPQKSSVGSEVHVEYVIIQKHGEFHKFVPFVKNGKVGMLDLFDVSFHGNIADDDSLTITTENK